MDEITSSLRSIRLGKESYRLLAFTGHKDLFGPTGNKGLAIGEGVDIQRISPLKTGGTGIRSESENHPDFLPDLYESGTPNIAGIAGLNAGVQYVLTRGINHIHQQEMSLTDKLISGLK